MVVFNPAPIIASMGLRRRLAQRAEEEEQTQQKEPQAGFRTLQGSQIEIFPYYATKFTTEYKTEENGQINFLEKVCKPKEYLHSYKMYDGLNVKIIQKN